MPKWTAEQIRVLYECAQLGAKKCQEIIRKQCGVNHTERAVYLKANKLGLSMSKTPNPCPQCGSTERIQSDGFCEKCHYDFLIAQQYAYADAQKRATKDHEEARKRSKREYNRIRKEKEREARENNWEPFKDWKKRNHL